MRRRVRRLMARPRSMGGCLRTANGLRRDELHACINFSSKVSQSIEQGHLSTIHRGKAEGQWKVESMDRRCCQVIELPTSFLKTGHFSPFCGVVLLEFNFGCLIGVTMRRDSNPPSAALIENMQLDGWRRVLPRLEARHTCK